MNHRPRHLDFSFTRRNSLVIISISSSSWGSRDFKERKNKTIEYIFFRFKINNNNNIKSAVSEILIVILK